MHFNNKSNNISSSNPSKKKISYEGNKCQVPNFDFNFQSKKLRTLKHISKSSRRKFDFSCTPTENINLPSHNNEVLSPILNTKIYGNPNIETNLNESPVLYKKRPNSKSENELGTSPIKNQSQNSVDLSPVLNSKVHEKHTEKTVVIESPVLYGKRHYSDSEGELDKSPVINRSKHKLIKLGKIRLQINNSCVQLRENKSEIINNTSKNIDNESVKSQKQIIPENNDTNVGDNIFKKLAWKFKQYEEKVEIETFESQEISTNIESDVKSLQKRNIQQKWNIVHTEDKVNIELINSQEILPNEFNNETNKTNCNESKMWNLQPTYETEILPQKSYKLNNKSNKSKQIKLRPTEEIEIELINSQEINTQKYLKLNNKTNKNKSSNESELLKLQPIEETEIQLINSPEILTQKSVNIQTSQSSRKTSEDENCVIDSAESTTSSLVTISSTGTVVQDSLEKFREEYQLSPRKKKKYKPGTLAFRFHKLLRNQKADVAIWKHELYLTSTSTYQIPATKEDHLITNLKICKMFIDFGINVWECIQSDVNNEKCLIVANISLLENLSLNIGDSIKIIPPFFIKYVLVNNFNVKTFINVHKILKL